MPKNEGKRNSIIINANIMTTKYGSILCLYKDFPKIHQSKTIADRKWCDAIPSQNYSLIRLLYLWDLIFLYDDEDEDDDDEVNMR